MAKYSKGAKKGVESAMKRMEKEKLRSGKSNKKVTNPKQAIAIGLSEARKKGAKVPKKAASKKPVAKKAISKKAASKKAASKKPVGKKAISKKSAPKKVAKKAASKAASKKPVAKKTTSKKAAAKKPVPLKKIKERDEDILPPTTDEIAEKNTTLDERNDNGTTNNDNDTPIEDDGNNPPIKIEDPITEVDKKFHEKAKADVDPNNKIRLSSSKSPIKPLSKKILRK